MAKKMIKVIVKWSNEPIGHVKMVANELKSFQELVGGYIETVPAGSGVASCPAVMRRRSSSRALLRVTARC